MRPKTKTKKTIRKEHTPQRASAATDGMCEIITKNFTTMETENLQNPLLPKLETAKALTEILNNALSGACTLEKMCGNIEAGTDPFSDAICAAAMSLADAAKVLAEATQKVIPSQSYE